MPYIRKDHLKDVIMSAFNEGVLAALEIDHHETTPEEVFYSLDYDEFYSRNFKNSKDD